MVWQFCQLNSYFKNDKQYQIKRNLRYSLKKRKIDIVLAEYGPVGDVNLEMLKDMKIPLVVHFHGYDASRYDVVEKHNKYQEMFWKGGISSSLNLYDTPLV